MKQRSFTLRRAQIRHTLKVVTFAIITSVLLTTVSAELKIVYTADWESLKTHPEPDWLADAKFGIYFHWGIYSVPAYHNEWYSRNMYQKDSKAHKHHIENYGPTSTFGYKDFIPMFTAEHFDPDDWADLLAQSGAKFAGPVTEHADGFAMWDSKVSRWNAANMGPKRDIVGEMATAIRDKKMKFIATFHHHWLWGWYTTYDSDTDTSNPEFEGIYGPIVPSEKAFDFVSPEPAPSSVFQERWFRKIIEVIDNYQPDIIWFDSRMSIIDETYRKKMLSYYYNHAEQRNKAVAVTYKKEDLPVGAAITDFERGRMASSTDYLWVTDNSIDRKSWSNIRNPDYKSVNTLVDELIDIVSKNGIFLLNITPRADGVIPEAVRDRLLGIGDWLEINGEAIYGTRPWRLFGEGPTNSTLPKGSFGGVKDSKTGYVAHDIRFTTKDDVLYALLLAWPGSEITIKSLHSDSPVTSGNIGTISMLGADRPLKWSQGKDGLTVQLPAEKPCEHAFVLKISK